VHNQGFCVWAPLDVQAMIKGYIAPDAFLLFARKMLGRPQDHGSIKTGASQKLVIGAHVNGQNSVTVAFQAG